MDNVTQAGSGRAGAGFVQASQSDLLLALKQASSESFGPAAGAQGIEAGTKVTQRGSRFSAGPFTIKPLKPNGRARPGQQERNKVRRCQPCRTLY